MVRQRNDRPKAILLTLREQGAKALVCYADDRTVLIVLRADRRIDSRSFKRKCGVKNLRIVSADELHALTGLEPGAVRPFGALFGLPTYLLVEKPSRAPGSPRYSRFLAPERGHCVRFRAD